MRDDRKRSSWTLALGLLALAAVGSIAAASAARAQTEPSLAPSLEPTAVEGLSYDVEFFPGTPYDPSVPTVESVLGFRAGDRAAFPAEIESYLRALEESSPRAELVEYARTYEGRPLYYLIVSSPGNMARLEEIRTGLARLADPRGLSQADADALLDDLPVTAWLAYSIHGDETSGSDAALAVAYHLTAATSPEVTGLLDDVVVLIDPMMNPDGRHRFLQQIAEHRSVAPNLDDQALAHYGYWPWGRENHYLFDLNRDWILGVNPETRGRIRAASEWHPLLFVDVHEMGALDTYLFGSGREPRNPNLPERRGHWAPIFTREQSEAFDRYHWKYYSGEWNEGWYPGYSDSWAAFRGAVGILYEQARIAEGAIRQPEGTLTTYREATHHQAVSSLANLETLHRNAPEMLREFLAEKRQAVSADGPWSGRTFAVLPTANRGRLNGFLDLMRLQGFEVWVATGALDGVSGVDQLGHRFSARALPAGTLLIPGRQPQAPLVATMLEFDRPMPPDYLRRERDSILRRGRSSIYDISAWSLTMLHGVEAVTLDGDLPSGVERWNGEPLAEDAPMAGAPAVGTPVGWALDGTDDRAPVIAARLMERGVTVRAADEDFDLGGLRFARGSLLVLPADNPARDDLADELARTATEVGLSFKPLSTGLGEGDLADIGGGHFTLLEPPRIALLARSSISSVDFGSIWHLIDQTLAIRHSHLDADSLDYTDLRRYNVLVLPDRWDGTLSESVRADLERWVGAGGTLIALGGSARDLTGKDSKLTAVRRLPDVLDRLDEYETAVLREWMARDSELPPTDQIWSHTAPTDIDYPWSRLAGLSRPGSEQLARQDAWERLFMPQGTILATRTDDKHWLTFGSGPVLPVLCLAGYYGSAGVLMAGDGVEAPIRFGVLSPDPDAAEPRRAGWGPVPAGQDLRLRMSGLLWPEAAGRIANSAFVTRERKGNGQVILFSSSPTFRGATRGTARVLLNAMIFGPGFGAQHPVRP